MIWWKWRSGFQVHVATLPWPTQGSSSLCPGVTFWAAGVANLFLINNWSLNKKQCVSYFLRWLVGFCSCCLPSFHTSGFSAGQVWEHNGRLQQCHPAPLLLSVTMQVMKREETSVQYPHIYLILPANPDFQINLKFHAQLVWKFWPCFGYCFIFACFTVNFPNIQWFSEVSKWDIWDLHLCERAADLLGVTYSSSSYSSATGTLHGCVYDSLLTAGDAVQRMKSMGWGEDSNFNKND